MLRYLLALSMAVLLCLSWGCASKSYLPKDAQFDSRLVGIWRGELPVEGSENIRRWKKKRRPDGALVVNMGLYSGDNTYLGREILSGFWWVEQNFYYEKIPALDHLVVSHVFSFEEDGRLKLTVQTEDTGRKALYTFHEKKVGEGH